MDVRFRDHPNHANAVIYIESAIHNLNAVLNREDISSVQAGDLIREAADYYLFHADEELDG